MWNRKSPSNVSHTQKNSYCRMFTSSVSYVIAIYFIFFFLFSCAMFFFSFSFRKDFNEDPNGETTAKQLPDNALNKHYLWYCNFVVIKWKIFGLLLVYCCSIDTIVFVCLFSLPIQLMFVIDNYGALHTKWTTCFFLSIRFDGQTCVCFEINCTMW